MPSPEAIVSEIHSCCSVWKRCNAVVARACARSICFWRFSIDLPLATESHL